MLGKLKISGGTSDNFLPDKFNLKTLFGFFIASSKVKKGSFSFKASICNFCPNAGLIAIKVNTNALKAFLIIFILMLFVTIYVALKVIVSRLIAKRLSNKNVLEATTAGPRMFPYLIVIFWPLHQLF